MGVSGTMPNNGAVNITPSTSAQPIAAGYHNGAGSVAGDTNLVSGNIRSGTSIFGVAGSPSVVNTSAATAAASDMVSGKTAYVNGSLITGTATAGSNINGPNGSKTFTIPDGLYSGSKTATANDTNLVAGNIKNGVTIFGVSGTVQPPPLKTGQTTAYGTGSDGALQKGASQSFTDNGDGTITDNTTGLMWEKKSADGSIHDKDNTYTWSGASYGSTYIMDGTITSTFLAGLNAAGGFAGHTDWRIPNRFELESILNLQNVSPSVSTAFNTGCAASCTVTACSCTQSYFYWSSTTLAPYPNDAWGVSFGYGYASGGNKSSSYYARAVRGGS